MLGEVKPSLMADFTYPPYFNALVGAQDTYPSIHIVKGLHAELAVEADALDFTGGRADTCE